jgi:hypothetical protein
MNVVGHFQLQGFNYVAVTNGDLEISKGIGFAGQENSEWMVAPWGDSDAPPLWLFQKQGERWVSIRALRANNERDDFYRAMYAQAWP